MDSNQVTIITGGGRGLGRVIALRMAQETVVLLVGRNEDDLQDTGREIEAAGGVAAFVVGDVGEKSTSLRTVELAKAKGLIISNLICNAAIAKAGAFHEFDEELEASIFRTNIQGTNYFCRACIPEMKVTGGGAIILISSVSGLRCDPWDIPYGQTKHAQVALARGLAREYGADGIIAVPICPGVIDVGMTERTIKGMVKKGMTEDEARRQLASKNPQKRLISAEEVAEMVAFVCSRKVTSISGNPIILTGGA